MKTRLNPTNPYTMKRIVLLVAIAGMLVACGGGEQTGLDGLKAEREALKAQIAELDIQIAELDTVQLKMLPKVEVQAIQTKKFEHYFEVQGNVEAEKNVVLYAEMGGNIKSIQVEEGEQVKAGKTLVIFDTEVISQNIKEVEKALELAEFVYEKQKNLWDQNIGSELQYRQAKNQKESLEQSLATLRSQRSQAVITAPFDGVVDEIFPNAGEMAPPGGPVLRLLNLNNVSIVSDVTENYLGHIQKGTPIIVEFPSLNDSATIKDASLTRAGQFINPANRTFKVQVDIDNTNKGLVPNLLAVLKVRDYVNDSTVVVPTKYVRQNNEGANYVFVLEKKEGKSHARRVEVELGMSYTNKSVGFSETEVLKGLSGSEVLITKGFKGIQSNDEVDVVNTL